MIVVMAALVTRICGDLAARAATTERVVADRITGLAIGGVDPVAFFTKGRTTIGRPDVEASEAGVIWRFENVDNRAFFLPIRKSMDLSSAATTRSMWRGGGLCR